jgi:dihydrofolate reductase
MIAIVAADKDWGIGRDGLLPWRLPGDLAFFKERTMGGVVIMGRRTFESLGFGGTPSPLPGRTNIVLTRDENYTPDGVTVVHSVHELPDIANRAGHQGSGIYVCGGAEIYRLLMPYTETCLVTRVDSSFDADAFFPDLDAEKFTGPTGEKKRYVLANESAVVTEKDIESGLTVSYRFCEYRAVSAE